MFFFILAQKLGTTEDDRPLRVGKARMNNKRLDTFFMVFLSKNSFLLVDQAQSEKWSSRDAGPLWLLDGMQLNMASTKNQ